MEFHSGYFADQRIIDMLPEGLCIQSVDCLPPVYTLSFSPEQLGKFIDAVAVKAAAVTLQRE